MSYDVKNDPQAIVYALVQSQNATLLSGISTKFHLAPMQSTNNVDWRNPSVAAWTITTAAATDADEALLLINELRVYTSAHFADMVAHDTVQSPAVTMAAATDTATAIALANEIKANINVHIATTGAHYTNDDTNTVTVADATDATDLIALTNDIREQMNDHTPDAPTTLGYYINPTL